jgi:hypothetical protein
VARFPLYADADVRGPLIRALKTAGWDVTRAVDELGEGAEDPAHFERAAAKGRVLVTSDAGHEARAQQWHRERRPFRGLIVWRQTVYDQMSYRQLAEVFEELAAKDDPFADYPIVRIWPRR